MKVTKAERTKLKSIHADLLSDLTDNEPEHEPSLYRTLGALTELVALIGGFCDTCSGSGKNWRGTCPKCKGVGKSQE